MSKIEKVLLGATGQKAQKKGEDRQKYLLRLALAANEKLSDEEWDKLEAEEGVQDWVTKAVEADNAEKPIKDFPDLKSEEEEEDGEASDDHDDRSERDANDADEESDEDEPEDEDNEPDAGEEDEVATTKTSKKSTGKSGTKAAKTTKKSGGTKAAKTTKTAASPAKKATAGKAAGSGKVSMRRALKQIVVKKPKTTVDELIEMLVKKGYDTPSKVTVTTIRADTRDTIKVLNEAGLTAVEP